MREVIVVGGGPAGTATAIHLARAGRDVTLLERARFPRNKPCGEGLLPPGVAELDRLGVLEALGPTVARLSGVRFRAGRAVATASFNNGRALGLRRTVLDTVLLEHARREGVNVCEGATVRELQCDERGRPKALVTDRGVERARVIVGADGLHSRLRKRAGLDLPQRRRRFAITVHAECPPAIDDHVEVLVRPSYELYLTPLGDALDVACLGDRTVVKELARAGAAGFSRLVDRELGEMREVQFGDAPGVAGPFPVRSRRAHRGRLVLVGDAAGFFDGISGEGLGLALRGARECARAVDEALRTGNTAPFRSYDRAVRRLARNSTLLAGLTLFLARRPGIAEAAVENLARHPGTFQKLVAINTGEEELSSLRAVDFAALFDPGGLLRRGRG